MNETLTPSRCRASTPTSSAGRGKAGGSGGLRNRWRRQSCQTSCATRSRPRNIDDGTTGAARRDLATASQAGRRQVAGRGDQVTEVGYEARVRADARDWSRKAVRPSASGARVGQGAAERAGRATVDALRQDASTATARAPGGAGRGIHRPRVEIDVIDTANKPSRPGMGGRSADKLYDRWQRGPAAAHAEDGVARGAQKCSRRNGQEAR